MSRSGVTSEWPLVVFTIALQFSCGIVLAATICDLGAIPSEMAAVRPLAIAAFPIIAVGMVISVLHLGRPLSAWKSLINLGQSRLSLEAVLAALFAASAFMYSTFWFTETTGMRPALGITTSALGVAAVVSSAMIYTVAAQPLWNSAWVPVSFIGTTLLLGGVGPIAFVSGKPGIGLASFFLGVTTAGSMVLLVSGLWMLRRFGRVRKTTPVGERLDEPAPSLDMWQHVCFVLYIFLAGIVPVVLARALWVIPDFTWPGGTALTLFMSALAGTLFGRKLMYDLALSRSRF